MEVNELRIGNLVKRLGEITIIDSIQLGNDGIGYVSTPKSGAITQNQIEPISLTEEWLLKFGFIKNKNQFRKNDILICKNKKYYFSFVNYDRHLPMDCFRILYSVHELQNLYFALTGKELNYDNITS